MSVSTWLPLLVGVRGAAASSTLDGFSRHPLYTRDVLRAVLRLSMEHVVDHSNSDDEDYAMQ